MPAQVRWYAEVTYHCHHPWYSVIVLISIAVAGIEFVKVCATDTGLERRIDAFDSDL